MDQVSVYFDLLTRWNRTLNLTSIRGREQILVRHFGESMYLTNLADVRGTLLDVGSGAGFPGLALKIAKSELKVVLLEPVGKKRAFLKEVARQCGLVNVEVVSQRVEDFAEALASGFDLVTLRAVGSFGTVLPALSRCLSVRGEACLWLTGAEAKDLAEDGGPFMALFDWAPPVAVRFSRDREIWIGRGRLPSRWCSI